jgi:catechol 2,3-dioxygenase-like lactoylglutathione lyase family enzyme
MIHHLSIGVRDLTGAKRFYDAALAPLGYNCLSEDATSLGYGEKDIGFWIGVVDHPVPPDDNSNLHFCLAAPTRAAVDAFHGAAIRCGGHDNGAPGLRPGYGPGYYAAYVVDPDGYRIEAYCAGA